VSDLPPSELNLTSGLSGTLIERIVIQSNKETRASGASVAEMVAKRQATARKTLENHEKRCSAGLIAGAGMFKLNEEILGFAKRAKEAQDAKQRDKQQRAKDLYNSLLQKVEAIRTKNLPPEKWTSAELNTMIQWYKRPNDSAMPPKKCDKLARYQEICGRADPQPPQLQNEPTTASLPLPPLPLVQEEEQHGRTSPTAAYAEPFAVTAITEPLTPDAGDGDLTVIGTS
jgi:hypothetical protein